MTTDPRLSAVDADAAAQLVTDRLGRRPQDAWEASVVLEAWGGLPTPRALDLGAAVAALGVDDGAATAPLDAAPRPGPARTELAALAVGSTAVAVFLAPLVRDLSRDVVELACAIALPPTVGIAWALLRPGGRLRLYGMRPSRPVALPAGAVAGLAVAVAAFGTAGLVGATLAYAWSGVMVLARLGSGWTYTAALVASAVAVVAGAPALPLLAAVAVLGVILVTTRFRSLPPRQDAVDAWLHTVAAAALGAGLGWLAVADAIAHSGGVPWIVVWTPAAVGLILGALHLTRLRQAIMQPRRPASVEPGEGRPRMSQPLRVLGAAMVRLVGVTTALSIVVVLAASLSDDPLAPVVGELTRSALLAVVALFVMLLDALGRGAWALAAVLVAVVADIAARTVGGITGGYAPWLLVASGLALAVVVPATLDLLARGDRTTPSLLIR